MCGFIKRKTLGKRLKSHLLHLRVQGSRRRRAHVRGMLTPLHGRLVGGLHRRRWRHRPVVPLHDSVAHAVPHCGRCMPCTMPGRQTLAPWRPNQAQRAAPRGKGVPLLPRRWRRSVSRGPRPRRRLDGRQNGQSLPHDHQAATQSAGRGGCSQEGGQRMAAPAPPACTCAAAAAGTGAVGAAVRRCRRARAQPARRAAHSAASNRRRQHQHKQSAAACCRPGTRRRLCTGR